MEEWRDIVGEPYYAISSLGRVKSKSRIIMRVNGRPQYIRERILKMSCDEWGYPMVRIGGHTVKVHKLVAQAFLPPQGKMVIRHLDGNPKNNKLSNLALGTSSENVLDGYSYRGNIRKEQKLTIPCVKEIKLLLMGGVPAYQIASRFGVSQQTVCDIKHNRIYRHVEV